MKNVTALIVAVAACIVSVHSAQAAVNSPQGKAIALDMERRAETTLQKIRTGEIKAQVPARILAEIRTFGTKSGEFARLLDEKKMTVTQARKLADELLVIAELMDQQVEQNNLAELKPTMKIWVNISRRLVLVMKAMP